MILLCKFFIYFNPWAANYNLTYRVFLTIFMTFLGYSLLLNLISGLSATDIRGWFKNYWVANSVLLGDKTSFNCGSNE